MSKQLDNLLSQLNTGIKRGELKKLAKAIKQDHELAMALWQSGGFNARLLAVLLMDKKLLDQHCIDNLASDMEAQSEDEQNHLSEWLMANQLMKSKPAIELLLTWRESSLPLLRRLYWYHQARLRWAGQAPPDNSEQLLGCLETDLAKEVPQVQWAMNFCAGWIGIFQPEYRQRCVRLGENLGLYKDEKVSRNCTPSYLPEFIRLEVEKRA